MKAGICCLAAALVSLCRPAFGAQAEPKAAPAFKKVMIVIFENTNYENALAQPFFAQFAKRGVLFSQYYAVTHPSQPNYVAMTAGTFAGVSNDKNVDLDARHIGDLLEAHGRTWKVYAEGYPGGCYLGAKSGRYARKHVPFLSFKNVQKDPKRCANVVDASALTDDVGFGNLADYSLYIPDIDNDGHDTGVAYADRWLAAAFGPLLKDPGFMKDVLLVVTFDEDEYVTNRIYTAMAGDSVVAGIVSNGRYDHYSLLRTIEDAWGLGTLGKNDDSATSITGVWK